MKYYLVVIIGILTNCTHRNALRENQNLFNDTIGGKYSISFNYPISYDVTHDQNGYLIYPSGKQLVNSTLSIWFENKNIYSIDSLISLHCSGDCNLDTLHINGNRTYKIENESTATGYPYIFLQEESTVNLVIKAKEEEFADRFFKSFVVEYLK